MKFNISIEIEESDKDSDKDNDKATTTLSIGEYFEINGKKVIYAGQLYEDNKYKDVFVALKDLVQKDGDGEDSKYFTHPEAEEAANKCGLYLPSKRELQLIALNIEAINTGLKTHGGEELSDSYYWSSSYNSVDSEGDKDYWIVYPASGDTDYSWEYITLYTRPVLVL